MKILTAIALLALVTSSPAAEIDAKSNTDRYVADAIEIETLPNGEIITRLVAGNRLTARQYWVDSVYHSQASILVFQGRGQAIQNLGDNRRRHETERQSLAVERAWND